MHERLLLLIGLLVGLAASNASAQPSDDLTGTYRCVQGCAAGSQGKLAFITENGWDLNIVTESGVAVRAWSDWFSPGSRIWIETLYQGTVYSPNG